MGNNRREERILKEGKSFASSSNRWSEEMCGPTFQGDIQEYLERKEYCEYLSDYMECLVAVKAVGAIKEEGGWVSPVTGFSYDNVMEYARAEGLGMYE